MKSAFSFLTLVMFTQYSHFNTNDSETVKFLSISLNMIEEKVDEVEGKMKSISKLAANLFEIELSESVRFLK